MNEHNNINTKPQVIPEQKQQLVVEKDADNMRKVLCKSFIRFYRVFSHDVTAAILVSQNNETAAMLVSQTSPVRVELLSYANSSFCSNKFA